MDLHDPEFFGSFGPRLGRAIERIRTGPSLAMSIREDVDGALADEMLSERGRAFAVAYYGLGEAESAYLEDWVSAFGPAANDYAVPPTEETFQRMAPILDLRFAAWQEGAAPPWPSLDKAGTTPEGNGRQPSGSSTD